MTDTRPRGRWPVIALLLALLPLAAALAGARGPSVVTLNMGPGNGPYVSGFDPVWEIRDSTSAQWAFDDAAVRLPLRVDGGPVAISWRASRVMADGARTDVTLAGQPIDAFRTRGGQWHERRVELGAVATPLALAFRTVSTSQSVRAIRLDDLRVELGERARLRLTGTARLRAPLLVALVFAVVLAAGWSARVAVLGAGLVSVLLTAGLLLDPWLTLRLLRNVPETLAVAGLIGVGFGHWLVRTGRAEARDVAIVAALGLTAFLVRVAAVNHPDFYYPDLRTHARLAESVARGGLDFFAHPSRAIWEHGVWRTQGYGQTYAFPYSPAFHLPFVPFVSRLGYDGVMAAMKAAAAAWSVVPIALLWAMARRLGVSPLGAALMVAIPTYTSRLTYAFMPSLFGHAFDLLLLLVLVARLDRVLEPRVALQLAGLVAACQLAYVSGVINTAGLVAFLAVGVAWLGPAPRVRRVAAILLLGLAGAALAVALYYRDFLAMAADVMSRGAAHGPSASVHPVQPFLAVLAQRTYAFFGVMLPPLAVAGLPLLWRHRPARPVLVAWVATWLFLLLGRARMPDVFAHGHESTLLTPLVCLSAGAGLGWAWARGKAWRVASLALVAALVIHGFARQWAALAEQLANAR